MDYIAQAYRTLLRQQKQIQGVQFRCCSYTDLNPEGLLVYCDPPYIGTAGYKATGKFDTDAFWATMFEWAKRNTVLVSEFAAPDDPSVEEVWNIERKVTMTDTGSYGKKTDRLYRVWP